MLRAIASALGVRLGDLLAEAGVLADADAAGRGAAVRATEAAILREGGFKDIAADSSVGELVYVRLSGNNPPGEQRSLELKIKNNDTPQSPDAAADYARQELEKLIRRFDDEDQAYTSLNLSMWTNRYGAFDDLARVKEWSAFGDEEAEE